VYPQRELTRLGVHKAALRRDIARERTACAVVAARVVKPLEWLDGLLATWRRFSPLAAVLAAPLGWAVARTVFPRLKIAGLLVRWAPLLFGAFRGLSRR
jgi:hypothetical protein